MNRPPIYVEISRPALPFPEQAPKIALVVERDADLRNSLTEYLLSHSIQVLSLSTTPHPDDVRRLQPDLLVLDLLCDGAPTRSKRFAGSGSRSALPPSWP